MCTLVHGQMITGTDTLYGNEWIKPDASYYKFPVSQDRLMRISKAVLEQAGVPVSSIPGKNFRIFRMGKEIPVYTTTDSLFGDGDYIEFYGMKMRSELDRFLYNDPDKELLNPEFSVINDTIFYFLSWDDKSGQKRIKQIDNILSGVSTAVVDAHTTVTLPFSATRIKAGDDNSGIFSSFDTGEGYGSVISKSFTTALTIPSVSAYEDSISVGVRLYGGIGEHQLSFYMNDQLFASCAFAPNSILDTVFKVPANILAGSNTLKINEDGASVKGFSVSAVRISYLRNLSFTGVIQSALSLNASQDTVRLEATGFYQGGALPVLYNQTEAYRMVGQVNGGVTMFQLPPAANEQQVLLHSGVSVLDIPVLTPVVFKDYLAENADFVIISHPALYDDGNGNNYVQQYADYRSSAAGGNHDVAIVDINELYDQFAYGNNRHFISIRNFAHFINKNWSKAKSIFIIGKGREYIYLRAAGKLSDPSNATFFVPTFGTPGSDNLFVIGPGEVAPVLAIGRIAVQSGQDIADYLKKMKDFESFGSNQQIISEQLWKKDIIHLTGGKTKNEQNLFKKLLEKIVPVIANNRFGGKVHAFAKTSTDPIQVSQNEQIFNLINNGVSIIAFLGHSAVGTFDFSIDNPQNYQNFGKYPLMFSLGCYSGNYHTAARGTGESFCFYKDKGALGFVATSYTGYPSILADFTEEFYRQQGGDRYGSSVGEVMKYTFGELSKSASPYTRLLIEQMSYHGDPEFRLHAAPGPDYLPDVSSLKIEPAVVSVQTDSLRLSFDINNIGEYNADTLNVLISQKLPAGDVRVLADFDIPTPAYVANISVKLPSFKSEAFGQNILYVDIDADNKLTELPLPDAKLNNSIQQNGEKGFRFFVTDNSAIPVSPANYSIVNNSDLTLMASTADPFAENQAYLIQIDTTKLFNSAMLTTADVTQKGGVIKWKPLVQLLDSVTYYWRITPDSSQTGVGAIWQYSSFFFRQNSPDGWSVGHNYQFNEGTLVNIQDVKSDQKMNFITDIKDVFIQNYVRKSEIYPAYYINNSLTEINYGNDISAGVYVGVIDPLTGTAWVNPKGGKYGSVTPASWRDRLAFPYPTADPQKRAHLISLLKDTIPAGHYVVFFTVQGGKDTYKPEDWAADSITLGTNIFQLLEEQGAKLIRNTVGNAVPYSFAYRKDVKAIGEVLAQDINDVASMNFGMEGNWDRGSFTSRVIGPAKAWSKLVADIQEDVSQGDYADMMVFGYDKALQNKQLLLDLKTAKSADLSGIDAAAFPYLQITANLKDTLLKTAPDIRYIRVYYQGVTELAVNPADAGYSFYRDTLEQGDVLRLSLPVENISKVVSDSVVVKYAFTAPDQSQEIIYKTEPAIASGQKTDFELQKTTLLLKGDYKLDIEVNPGPVQTESHYFNNLATLKFTVLSDLRNPLLNVLFDGVRILDGDIVSARPEITIELKDENKFLPLADTSLFKLFLKFPGKNVYDAIPMGSTLVQFNAAKGTGKDNRASIVYKPNQLDDGEYELLVQAKDASNNPSGKSDYKIRFKVINQRSVSSFLPYPNPFSTSAGFAYTLTGDQTPEHVRIRIYSVSGSLVREITEQELGVLRIGTHITDYKWDGTDMFGNRLANGVYLYQVTIKDNTGRQWDEFDSKANDFMQSGFGKIVILR